MRVSWHAKSETEFQFIRIGDNDTRLPIEDRSVDYVQALGVIHHASEPSAILREFVRILKPGGEIRIMVYNADSVHVQLHVGFVRRFLLDKLSDLSAEEAFERTADLGAPIARCVRMNDVDRWCEDTDINPEFLGGYFVPGEVDAWEQYGRTALNDRRVVGHQREFLENLITDSSGFPIYQKLPAGLGGVYRLLLVPHH